MSSDEEINVIYLLKQISKQQEDHIKASNTFREDMKTSLATIETKAEYTAKTLSGHDSDIETLKDAHSKQKGAVWVFGLIGLGGLIEVVREWVK
jgi:hypothetical protein